MFNIYEKVINNLIFFL